MGLKAGDACCPQERRDSAPWAGGSAGASGTAVFFGLKGELTLLNNGATGETCLTLTFCPFRFGLGFGASAGVELVLGFTGPYCGDDLEGTDCSIDFDAVKGAGVGASVGFCGERTVGIEAGGEVGAQLALTFNFCTQFVLNCWNTPCECE